MPDWTKSPKYQRALQRLRRLSPDQQAVFSSLAMDESFADEEMRKRLRSMQMAAGIEGQAKSLELGERGLKLKEKEFKFEQKQIVPATVLGAGELALGVYGGLEERKTAKETARSLLALKSQIPPRRTTARDATFSPRYEDDPILRRRTIL